MVQLPHSAPRAEQIDWHRFLERRRLPAPTAELLASFEGSSILVTGAGGSIGSALSLRLAGLRPRQLVLLDASEQALHRLQSVFADTPPHARAKLILANISNRAHLEELFEAHRPQLVFHAAAYKHVPLLEEHPLEAIANNALGTLTVADCAKSLGAARIVLLSTDKAAAPISILGASKRIAENIVLAHDGIVVRLGNVLGTEGSVGETFLHQIALGGPVRLTDPNAERYFMTREEAVDLLLSTAVSAQNGSVLVPRLDRQYRIAALADFLIAQFSPTSAIQIVYTGLRAGDKAREVLWSCNEEPSTGETNSCLTLKFHAQDRELLASYTVLLKNAVERRDLATMMEVVRHMVPDYEPTATMLALLPGMAPGAMQR